MPKSFINIIYDKVLKKIPSARIKVEAANRGESKKGKVISDEIKRSSILFTAAGAERHYLIIKILVKLVLYDFIRRNASRKVPDDFVKDWEWANKLLESIKAGTEIPDGLPAFVNADGSTGRIISGNNKNEDFYI